MSYFRTFQNMIFKSGALDDIVALIDEPVAGNVDLQLACVACLNFLAGLAHGSDDVKRYLFDSLPQIIEYEALTHPAVGAAFASVYSEVFVRTEFRLAIKLVYFSLFLSLLHLTTSTGMTSSPSW